MSVLPHTGSMTRGWCGGGWSAWRAGAEWAQPPPTQRCAANARAALTWNHCRKNKPWRIGRLSTSKHTARHIQILLCNKFYDYFWTSTKRKSLGYLQLNFERSAPHCMILQCKILVVLEHCIWRHITSFITQQQVNVFLVYSLIINYHNALIN